MHLPQAMGFWPRHSSAVDDIGRGHGLGEGDVDRPAAAQAHLELVGHDHRADQRAVAAGGALVLVHVAGLFAHADLEIAHVAGNVLDLGVGQQFNLGMSTDIHHLGAENSYAALDVGIDLVELGHDAADGRLFLHQVDLVAGVGQVQGGLDARHPAADDQRAQA